MKFGHLKKGWFLRVTFHNPDILRYRKTGRLRHLCILGIINIHWLEKKKRERNDKSKLNKWLALNVMKWSEDPLSPWGQPGSKAPSYVREDGGMISQADWDPLVNIKHAVMVMRAIKKAMEGEK